MTDEDLKMLLRKKYPSGYFLKRPAIDLTEATNALHAMKIADFVNWKVTVEELYVAEVKPAGTEFVNVSFQKAIARRGDKYSSNDIDIYQVVSPRYEVLPNEDCASSIDKITESFDASYMFAREYQGGRTCISIRGAKSWKGPGKRDYSLEIHVWNSHDTSRTFSGDFTIKDDRLNLYLLRGDRAFAVKHTSSSTKSRERRKLDFQKRAEREVKAAVAKMKERMQDLSDKSIMLASVPISESDLGKLLRDIFIISDNMSSSKSRAIESRRSKVLDIFTNHPELEEFKGTAWAAYFALVIDLDGEVNLDSEPRDYLNSDWEAKDAAFKIILDFVQKLELKGNR